MTNEPYVPVPRDITGDEDFVLDWETRELMKKEVYEAKFGPIEPPVYTLNVTKWISTFNPDSATECFTAVQELKKRLEGDTDADNN